MNTVAGRVAAVIEYTWSHCRQIRAAEVSSTIHTLGHSTAATGYTIFLAVTTTGLVISR